MQNGTMMGSGSRVRFRRALVVAAGLVALSTCGGKSGVQIVSATYGASCGGVAGNATKDLQAKCEGEQVCNYVVDVTVLGDPKPGCMKEYEAQWTCGKNPEIHAAKLPGEAGFGGRVQLSCAAVSQ
jgi:hypothetical protein